MKQLEFLQIELNKTQGEIATYRELPHRKKKKRRLFEVHCFLLRWEIKLKELIKDEEAK